MSLALDHLVIRVDDLDQAIRDYREVGFNVQPGGSHADGVTHNALVVFTDGSYLELIAFLKPGTDHRWEPFRASGFEGFIDFALLPDDIVARIARTRADGHPDRAYQGPFDGGRLRPDGERLEWRIGQPPSPDLPFLCGDVTPRSLRVREGDVRVHPNGVTGIGAIGVVVNDVRASLARYAALLGTDAADPGTVEPLPQIGVECGTVQLTGTRLQVLGPLAGSASSVMRWQTLQTLDRRGEGLSAVSLTGPRGSGVRMLPIELTHGAQFEVRGD